MKAFLPHDPAALRFAIAAALAVLVLGFALTRLRRTAIARLGSWTLVLGSVLATHRSLAGQPAGFRMLALIAVGFLAMKAVVSIEAHASGGARLPAVRWFAFALGWPGMRPALFARELRPDRAGGLGLLSMGLLRLALGVGLVVAARFVWARTHRELLAAPLLLVGASLVLHFGLANLLAAFWRFVGFGTDRLFQAPLAARNLSEFWSRRWNIAYSEMTSIGVYRPLAGVLGRKGATVAAFFFSGALHELAISLPVRAGYGLPTAYFLLHGGLVLLERRLERRGRPVGGAFGRVWCIVWLVAPLPILFHPPFWRGVLWPIIGAA